MGAVDYVIIALVALILGGAAWYVWRAKKKGAKCIGCPYAECPSRNKGCNCKK